MMNDEVEKLRQQLQDLNGRVIADGALLRMAVLTHSTPQLRTTQAMVEKLSEDITVKSQLRSASTGSLKAFEDQRKHWLQVLAQEIASRDAATPMI